MTTLGAAVTLIAERVHLFLVLIIYYPVHKIRRYSPHQGDARVSVKSDTLTTLYDGYDRP